MRRLTAIFVSVILVLTGALVSAGGASAAPTTARWIWAGTSSADQWVAFRKTVNLNAKPTSAVTTIAVDSKYWLWVNGTLVTFEGGLKRGPNPTGTYYDEYDLAPYLQAGNNTIAILAWYFGKDGFSHKSSGQGGLLFQSDLVGSSTTAINSDISWKAKPHGGYKHETTGAQPNYRLSESNVYYDARDAGTFAGWHLPAYAGDSAWPAASDRGAVGAAPWNALVKRPIPPFRFSGLLAYANAASLPTSGNGGTISARLPSNLQVTPYLQVDAPAGAVIGIRTDHYGDGGNGTDFNVRATYVTTGGVQEFEALGWMSGTAVEYTIPAGVTILALRYRESGYDTDIRGSFTSSDPFFDQLWTKAARTMYLNMRDNYFDCPTRERAQWWGDVVNQLKEGFYTFDSRSNDLGRKAINELTAWQKPTGQLYSPVPSGNYSSELPAQMLASVWSLGDFYDYTGDVATVSAAYPNIKRYLELFSLDADGLVAHRAGDWDWSDWGDNIDGRVMDNAWYYLALETAIRLANLSGNSGDVAAWQSRRNSISNNFDRVLWRGTEYRSPGYAGDTDDRGNALAVVAGLAAPGKYPAITEVLRTHMNASPYMEFYVLEAMYQMSQPEAAQQRMKTRYAAQVSDPGYTLWEFWTKGGWGTDNHAWNGGPLYALSAYGAGVRPTGPGYSSYEVMPQPGTFTSMNVNVPTVRGDIRVTLARPEATRLTMRVAAPSVSNGTLGVPTLGMSSVTVKANGTVVYQNGAATNAVSGLTFARADANYISFSAAAGTWDFEITGSGQNLALGRPVASNDSFTNADWSPGYLTDGIVTSVAGAKGFSSAARASQDIASSPISVEVDLGSDVSVSSLRLHPRTDQTADGGGTPAFPVDFVISVRTAAGSWVNVRTITGQSNPAGVAQTYDFAATLARHVRITVTRLGARASDEGGTFYRLQLAELAVLPGGPPGGGGGGASNGAAPPGDLPPGFLKCADENGTCSFTGTRLVAFGAGNYVYRQAAGSSACSAAAFGSDPVPGVLKGCYVAPAGGPEGYTSCGAENSTCSVSSPTRIAYGANGAFVTLLVTGSTPCTSATFGSDPIATVTKGCYLPPAGGPAAGWTQCAAENSMCGSVSGQRLAYGANGAFSYRSSTGNPVCGNTLFGDPISGVVKACYVRTGAPSGYATTCATENGACAFTGFRTVAYGGAGSFTYKSLTGGTACTSAAFGGDPIFGVGKSCYLTP